MVELWLNRKKTSLVGTFFAFGSSVLSSGRGQHARQENPH